jgi:hypothetical protein
MSKTRVTKATAKKMNTCMRKEFEYVGKHPNLTIGEARKKITRCVPSKLRKNFLKP